MIDWSFSAVARHFESCCIKKKSGPATCREDDIVLVGAVEGVDNSRSCGPPLLVHRLAQLHQVLTVHSRFRQIC